jgi:GlpG protein
MRQIATLPDEDAHRLADYLLTLDIQTQLHHEGDGTSVWVCDEDRVPQARQELENFQRNPADTRYRQAATAAGQIRRDEERSEKEYQLQQQYAQQKVAQAGSGGHRPVTFAVMAMTVLTAMLTQIPSNPEIVLTQEMFISTRPADFPRLSQVASGEVWRLVTPMFLHFGWIHIVFNLLWFLQLAGQIEAVRGSWRLLLLILVVSIASNLTQYYLGAASFVGGQIVLRPSVYFGGLSGVVYGLFGYLWVKSRLRPDLGLYVSQQTVMFMVGWFFLCLFFLKGVANGGHAGGLIAGAILAALPIPSPRRE